ncbi:MAG TPA: V-type ATPase subunit [Candidatus Hydrogenedentes bacterium]|nr:V-type ATPase subunit [Candidatus Hydrogenedentota bacterium]
METIEAFSPYMNARISGMRSKLFSKQHFEDLLQFDDVQKIVDDLMQSPYQQEMAEALTRFSGADAVEEAVSRNLASSFQILQRMTQGLLKDLANRFLMRWDLTAVKSLLRLRHNGLDAQTGASLLAPGPSMTVALMKSLAETNSMEELVQALVTWKRDLSGPLEGALAEYRQQQNNLAVLEDALDRAYFVRNVAELKSREDDDSKILRSVLRMEIDRINLRSLLQLRGAYPSADVLASRLLPMGWLNEKKLEEMANARDASHAMESLANTPYHDLAQDLYSYVQSARFSPMDRHFDVLVIRYLRHESHAHVMSFAVLMHYAWSKYNEAVNLRLIARGTAANLPNGKIREEMMHA